MVQIHFGGGGARRRLDDERGRIPPLEQEAPRCLPLLFPVLRTAVKQGGRQRGAASEEKRCREGSCPPEERTDGSLGNGAQAPTDASDPELRSLCSHHLRVAWC